MKSLNREERVCALWLALVFVAFVYCLILMQGCAWDRMEKTPQGYIFTRHALLMNVKADVSIAPDGTVIAKGIDSSGDAATAEAIARGATAGAIKALAKP